MASVDVPVALLGYGTVGAAVNRLLVESAEDIERATGHRLRVVRALVRDTDKERGFAPEPGVLTTDFAAIRDDPSIAVVAEVMGGVAPTGDLVLGLLRAGRPVVSANKQLVARRGGELFAAAHEAGVQLRFEASVCAAIPVIKVLRESLVVTTVHRVLGIVNGTTNFMLTRMEAGASYDEALARSPGARVRRGRPDRRRLRRRRGGEDGDPRDRRLRLARRRSTTSAARASRVIRPEHVRAAAELGIRRAADRLRGARGRSPSTCASLRRSSTATTRSPRSTGAFNAVMLQGDAIREITLEGPGAGGIETASAVVADMVSVIGTDRHGLPPERRRAGASCRAAARGRAALAVVPRHRGQPTGRACSRTSRRGSPTHGVSVAQPGAARLERPRAPRTWSPTRRRTGALDAALDEIEALDETLGRPTVYRVISRRNGA